MNRIILGNSHSPYFNLALEECLFNEQGDDGVTLYLWQNEHTVVIGRNQNAYRECRTRLLSEEGGNLARRTTGGGAVYHDLGNLNFSFIASKQNYNLKRQLSVIIDAVGSLGINACFTGRNDITTDDGAKFSGNAFLHNRTTSIQHGTLLHGQARPISRPVKGKARLKGRGQRALASGKPKGKESRCNRGIDDCRTYKLV